MSLPHAILTALLEKPSSGLELTRRFDKSIGFFWPATHQQIYRELGRLEAAGLIRALPGPPAVGRRKEYEVLDTGREALRAWTVESEDPRAVREPLMLRVRAAAVIGSAGLAGELRRHLELHTARLAGYREIEARDFPDGEKAPEGVRLQHAILAAGIGLEEFWIGWLTSVLETLASDQ